LTVGEPKTASSELLAEHPVLLQQVGDDRLLVVAVILNGLGNHYYAEP